MAPAIAFRPPISGAAGERAVRTLRAFASLPDGVTGRVNLAVVGERRSFALLRPIADTAAQERIREFVLEAYAAYEQQASIAS